MDRILAVAEASIAQKGSDQVKMSEVAAGAEISIGSLYQYFPDKGSIIRTLATRYAAASRACVEAALAPVHDAATLRDAFIGLVDQYHRIVLSNPVMRDLSSAMRADKALAAQEIDESAACGALLTAAILRARRSANPKKTAMLAFLIWQLGEETMRLALTHRRSEGAALVDAYKAMSLRAIEGL